MSYNQTNSTYYNETEASYNGTDAHEPADTVASDNEEVSSDALLVTITIYGTIFLVGWLYFELFRERDRLAYSTRDRSEETRNRLCAKKYSFLEWIRPVQTVSDDEVAESCGLDILMFLRFQRIGIKVALVGVMSAVVLLPVYATGGALRDGKDELEYLTMANVKAGSARLYASVLAAYAMTFTVLKLVLNEYRHYTYRRHTFMTQSNVHQYSVLVEDIPKEFRSDATLKQYMNYLFPNQISQTSLAVKPAKLKELQAKIVSQEKARANLEHALVFKSKTGKDPVHKIDKRALLFGGVEVNSIETYEEELVKLNNEVETEIQSIMTIQQLRESSVNNSLPDEENSSAQTEEYGTMGQVPLSPLEVKDMIMSSNQDEGNNMPSGTGVSSFVPIQQAQPAGQFLSRKVSSILEMDELASNAAFVTFTTLQAAQTAEQFLQSKEPFEFTVSAAPAVDDVLWKNIGLKHKVKVVETTIATGLSVLIIFFWTIPTTFVVALASADGLSKAIPATRDFIDNNAWFVSFLEQLGPLLFIAMGSIVPSIFRALSANEGHSSVSKSESSMFMKLVYFQLVQRFFVATVSGSILNELQKIINEPASIINILGESIPGQSSFFMSVITIQIGLSFTLELVRIVPRATAFAHRLIAPQLTERERISIFIGIRPILQNYQFNYFQPSFLAQSILIFILIVVYAPVAPVLTFFGLTYFLIGDTVYRRMVFFVYDPALDTAGAFWHSIYHAIIVALIMGQLSLVGILGIKKSGATVFLFFLPIITLYFNRHICSVYPRIAKNLPMEEACRVDRHRESDVALTFLDSSFLQPCLQQQPLAPEYTVWVA